MRGAGRMRVLRITPHIGAAVADRVGGPVRLERRVAGGAARWSREPDLRLWPLHRTATMP